jgi:hypothetical protein
MPGVCVHLIRQSINLPELSSHFSQENTPKKRDLTDNKLRRMLSYVRPPCKSFRVIEKPFGFMDRAVLGGGPNCLCICNEPFTQKYVFPSSKYEDGFEQICRKCSDASRKLMRKGKFDILGF